MYIQYDLHDLFWEERDHFISWLEAEALFSYMSNNTNYELLLISSQLQNPFKMSSSCGHILVGPEIHISS